MIYRTTTYYKIREMTKRVKVIQGGQGSSKNKSIVQILKEDMETDPGLTTIMTDTYDNLKDGVIADFKELWEDSGLDWDGNYNKSEKDLKHFGSIFQFRYISDKKESAGKSKRRKRLYINEANKIGWGVASTYIGRTKGDVYIDYNPDSEFWAHTKVPLLKDRSGKYISEQIIVTYFDNEMIPDTERDYIEARKDNVDWYRVYGLGLTGFYSDRRIYNYSWIDKIPNTAIRINSGMDFGYSPDPTILVDLYIDGTDLICDERFCKLELIPEKLEGADRLSVVDMLDSIDFPKGQMMVGDTDGTVQIFDMRRHGYNIRAVSKPPGSQLRGIEKVKCYNIKLTKRSINIKKGIESWFRKVNKDGEIISEPQGHEPDGLAAIRYGVMTYIR